MDIKKLGQFIRTDGGKAGRSHALQDIAHVNNRIARANAGLDRVTGYLRANRTLSLSNLVRSALFDLAQRVDHLTMSNFIDRYPSDLRKDVQFETIQDILGVIFRPRLGFDLMPLTGELLERIFFDRERLLSLTFLVSGGVYPSG